jgi:hypothetical protein
LDFDDPPDGARVKPKDRGELAILNTEETSGLMVTAAADLKEMALANTKVRELLGARFTLISTRGIDPGYKHSLGRCATAPSKARLTFYSYTNNVTVDVEMKGEAITGLSRREAYLPPEGEEELQNAIVLAGKDGRIASGLEGLEGHAILMQPDDGVLWNEPGYGHRVFWVTFSKGLSGNPEYWAVVDLSEQKVLKAEKETTHP